MESSLAVGVEAVDGSPVLEHALDYVLQLVQRLCQVPTGKETVSEKKKNTAGKNEP